MSVLIQASILILLAVGSYLLSFYLTRFLVRLLGIQILKRIPTFDKNMIRLGFTPIRAGLALMLFTLAKRVLLLPENWDLYFQHSAIVFSAFILTWFVFSVVDLLGEWLAEHLKSNGQGGMIGMIPLGRKTLKAVAALLALVTFLQNIGVNVTALIAGISVGGIAVALGAQKMVGDFIGGIMLLLDHPIRVGDECRFGSQTGKVEEIGIRTTKIRTQERSLLSVPNADLAQMQLENLSLRDRIRFTCTLGVHRMSSSDQIRLLLIELQKILYAHPKVDSEGARVRFVGISLDSLDLAIQAYVLTTEHREFLAVQEDLLLRFLDKVAEVGTSLALSLQESYSPSKIDPDFARDQIAALRANHALPVPDFSQAQIDQLDDTLDYPPQGSIRPELS
ncbi:MAG: mechanosensitive ion channel family protein [Myxococcaceae bacterium]|nr:mechanosensitive ion channel family protein [Myxococcaceae bacterium]MBH2006001.1 mechanosensitive ion channel family protein [Myxococcaceae bacterium]